mgnify:CR=1 FL=1
MEIIKGLYLNTDKIIIGKEYKVIYKKEIENETYISFYRCCHYYLPLNIAGNIGFDVVCAQHSLDMDSGNTTLSILIFPRIHVLS